jgi:cephalosporin hydroxylase
MSIHIPVEVLNRKLFGYTLGNYQPPQDAMLTADEKRIIDAFHDLYYRRWAAGKGTIDLSWLGYHVLKSPLDLWIYQEILCETRPDVIIETGTRFGGSALFLANLCQLIGNGRVLTVDLQPQPNRPQHELITYVHGASTHPITIEQLKKRIPTGGRVMVLLDSDHARDHVRRELELYGDFVTPGCYLIVEDTNINGHPTFPEHGPGPWEAVEDFLAQDQRFVADRFRERFLLTLNPNGFLRRV